MVSQNTSVTLYRYYNTDPDGKLRCEIIKARDTPKAYAFACNIIPKNKLDILPPNGYGELWTLKQDDAAVSELFLNNLLQVQLNSVIHVEAVTNRLNRLVVAMGGAPKYPSFQWLGHENASL